MTRMEGAEGREAAPALHLPHTLQCYKELVDIGHVPFLPRSALACWWSVMHLIRTASPCRFWTFTSPYAMPLWWFGERHRKLVTYVNLAAKQGKKGSHGGTICRNWGGVRVFEVNPNGTGFHAHWVMRGRMDWYLMQELAIKAGLGEVVLLSPRPCTPKTAYYVAKYLLKGDALPGARKWANIGTYDGITGRDIVNDSARIRDIKAWQVVFRAQGKHRFLAYRMAVQMVDDGIPLPGTVPF